MPECPLGGPRCPESICDCFIDSHPENPLDPHPEDYAVRVPGGWFVPDPIDPKETP